MNMQPIDVYQAGMLFLRVTPGQNLIEDDGAERCGAYSSHGESAELERKVTDAGLGGTLFHEIRKIKGTWPCFILIRLVADQRRKSEHPDIPQWAKG